MSEPASDTGADPSAKPIPAQTEMPFAFVQGEAWLSVPQDLYIPPDALEIILDAFEGPLDLLWYLIRRQNIDILDIPIAKITEQYMAYIALMQEMRFELAAEYLLMAALLAEIKSRMLLPKPASDDEEDEDPRAELIRRLQEYERFKQAAEALDELPRLHRDVFQAQAEFSLPSKIRPQPPVMLDELISAIRDVVKRADLFASHQVEREPLSVRETMTHLLSVVPTDRFINLLDLVTPEQGRLGVVVTFMALLELVKERLMELTQIEAYSVIHLKRIA